MNQDPNYPRFGNQQPHQYGLDSFDTRPVRKRGFFEKAFGSGFSDKLTSPLVATGALLVCGVAFAAVIMAVYPGGETEAPVVRADTLAYKEIPADPGGMSIPNRDSTVFAVMDGRGGAESAPVENLFSEEETVDKLAAFARQVEDAADETRGGERVQDDSVDGGSTLAAAESEESAPVTLQKIEEEVEKRMEVKPPKPEAVASASDVSAPVEAERPKIIHKPGESPETLEFVKSVLDRKDSNVAAAGSISDVATGAASIKPAAGNALRDDDVRNFAVEPGQHYVQLGSVKSLDGAQSEWGRLQKAFSTELSGVPHRVQAAEVADRGTFYRIQAGPMSKESAGRICDSIKAQKPGGCLVTQ
ncbi:MAG: SPOR domain-containing protein [Alphaproteobacteria bacterium]